MKRVLTPVLLSLGVSLGTASAGPRALKVEGPWCALHLLSFQNDADLQRIEAELPALAARGVNVLVLEVDYGFEFRSHPELRSSERPITRRGAKRLVKAADRYGIRVIPEFQSFGHQSWAKETFTLLTRYPELDSTPGAFPQNEGIYCREWDPMNPRVYQIVYALVDEIIDAFDADAVHFTSWSKPDTLAEWPPLVANGPRLRPRRPPTPRAALPAGPVRRSAR